MAVSTRTLRTEEALEYVPSLTFEHCSTFLVVDEKIIRQENGVHAII